MKALVCRSFGGPETLRLEEVDRPTCADDALLVRVEASGLNYADLVFLRGDYQGQSKPPFIPGLEVFGTVVEVGSDVTDFAAGDKVIGQVWLGGYAEYAAMEARTTVRLTVPMPAAEAAGFYVNYGTAYSAIVQRAAARAGETLLVLGAGGGVGLAAVQIGKALGLKVIADCRGSAKQALVAEQGADLVVDHSADSFGEDIAAFTGGKGCDVVLDMIGGEATRKALGSIARLGRLVIVGFAGGAPYKAPANHLLVKNCAVIGHWWGDLNGRDRDALVAMFDALFELVQAGRLRPVISDVVAFEDIPSALGRYAERSVVSKMVCVMETSA